MSSDGVTIQASGATFPAPLYQRWFLEYYKQHPNVRVNYQPIGSGAGIRQFTEGLVNFAASDAAMSDDEIAKVSAGVQLLPMTAGSIALCYNVPGAPDELRLSRQAYVDIFLGNITQWDDPAITRTNPGVSLPPLPITVVRRAEGSGTTYAFTNHLSAISDEWKRGPGKGKSVVWPVGIGARGSDGVAALVKQTRGAIGYFELGYAELSRLPKAALENKAGTYMAPTVKSGQAALVGAKIPDDLRIWLPDPDGKNAYPIVTYTWILCYKTYDDPKLAAELKQVLRYCLTDGQKISAELGYIPLPEEVAARVLKALDQIAP
jgi:phosphate transport system substrate-binding protein